MKNNEDISPLTRARLLRYMLEDLEPYGFESHDNKKMFLKNHDIVLELGVDVIHRGMDRTSPVRQAHLQAIVQYSKCPLDLDPKGVFGLWTGVGWIDRHSILDETGVRSPYLFTPEDNYDYLSSGLRKDLLDIGIPFLVFLSDKDNFLEYLLCRPFKIGKYSVSPGLSNGRNKLSIALYIFDKMQDVTRAKEAVEGLKHFDALSAESHSSMQALMRKKDIADILQRYDSKFYQTLQ